MQRPLPPLEPTSHRAGRRRRPGRVGRSPLGRWAPLALLVLSLGVAAAAVSQAQRAVGSRRETARRLVRDYGAFAAWSFGRQTAEALRESYRAVLGPAVHARPGRPVGSTTPEELLAEGAAGDDDEPVLRPAYAFRVVVAGGAPTFAGDVPPVPVRDSVAAAVRAHARRDPRLTAEFRTLVRPVGGVERVLVYALVASADGARVAYGFELDSGRVAARLRDLVARRPLLPAVVAAARTNAELLALELRTPGGRTLFAAGGALPAGGAPAGVDSLGAEFGGLAARAAIRPAAAGALVGEALEGGGARLPLLGGLLALACGLGVVAVHQLRREGELARLRSDFVSSVSHELRTPLAQVQLFLETLRHGRWRTEAQREWILDNMERETTRLTALVDNVLHFSRAERGATGGTREPVALAPYLDGVLAAFAPLAASRQVRFETALEPGLVARLHAESFRQVILNLLDNAVKYGRKGQTVRVTCGVADGRIRIAVEDQGPGVAPAERERIWEPFRRGERAVGSVAVGSGIGLSVVREIVEWHEGAAWVEDAPGGGARFVVDLPGWRDLSEPGGAGEAAARAHPGAVHA